MSALPLIVLALAVLVIVALVAWQAMTRPMLRRLALRNATRRPWETFLVILGSLLGTAIITGSFIVGDTLDSSIRATAHTQLGPVDELVEVDGPAAADRLVDDIRALKHPSIDGALHLVTAPGAIATLEDDPRAEPAAQVVALDFEQGRRFGSDPSITGLSGDTPGSGGIVLGADVAESLDVAASEDVLVYLYGRRLRLSVETVLPQKGLAGFWTDRGARSPVAFVSDGLIEEVAGRGIPPDAAPPRHLVLVSNRGGVEDGAALTDRVVPVLEEVLPGGTRVDEIKRDRLEQAEAEGRGFTELFVGIGSFALVAGILLLVNIFVMLAEERKSQLGTLRAVGMQRSDLVRAFVIEGSFYSVIAAAVGAIAGIGVGWGIVGVAAPIFGALGRYSLDLVFSMSVTSLAGGFCIGLLISVLTVSATSVRISRLNVIRAIRDLPDPRPARTRLRTVLIGLIVVIAGGSWLAVSLVGDRSFAGVVLGPPLVLFGAVPVAQRVVRNKAPLLVAASASMLWGIFGDTLTGGAFYESGDIFAFVLQGILLTFSAVVVLTQTQDALERGIRQVAASRLALRLGLAYPLARRFRTGLTLGMYSLVMFTMVFIAIMSNVFGGQIEATTRKVAGGFDVVATASASDPPRPSDLRRVEGVEEVATIRYGVALFRPESADEATPWTISGIDASLVEGRPPRLNERLDRYPDDRAAWAALLSDPTKAIVPEGFLQSAGGPPERLVAPGDSMTVIDPASGRSVTRHVVAMVDSDFVFGGAYMSAPSVRQLFGPRIAPTRFFINVDGGEAEGRAVAADLQGRFIQHGVEAKTFRTIVEDFGQLNLQFLRLMQGYLALGLLVGIAGLGVVMVRAVRERRREIGVLRSLGFQPGQVRGAFTLESGFVAVEGIVVGSLLAVVTASQLIATGEFGEGLRFIVPWANVTILMGLALAGSLAATAWPARQASTIPPAVALRIAD